MGPVVSEKKMFEIVYGQQTGELKTSVVGTQKNCLNETDLLSTQNIC